jgi:phospholipid/cholesterol/gamma-HCH transport system substrate-binding protein
VEVGKVTAVHLFPDRVVVDMAIRHGEKIPAGVGASVKELTAAAEQYMDLVPPSGPTLVSASAAGTGGGPYLKSGYTIPEERTQIPVSIGTLLATVNSLVGGLNASDLNTLSHALAQGLQGVGDNLRSIIVDGSALLKALQSATPGTLQLIQGGNTVLNTFNKTSGDFADFSRNLNVLSAQVAQSNTDLVKLLQNGAVLSGTAEQQLAQYEAPTISLLNDLGDLSNLSFEREPAFRALFEVLPLFAQDIAATSTGGQIRFELTFNYNHTVCPYTSTMAEPNTLVAIADLTANCGVQAPDLLQRGADKAPTPQG